MTYKVTPPANAGTSQTVPMAGDAPQLAELETKIGASKGLAAWLARNNTSFAVSSYQSNRLILVGTMPDGTVSVHQTTLSRVMGMSWDRNGLWLASRVQLWRLENILPEGTLFEGTFDLRLMPRTTYITGDIDVHELAADVEGRPVFVNTSFSCLATIDPVHSFRPVWKPKFITALEREDRCHMNGLGMVDGRAKYVTAVSQTDVANGWHGRPLPKGVIIDVETDEVVTDQLSMPHSPRVAADGKLYALDSARGYFVEVDRKSGELRDVTFCPGFLRGLAFINGHALVTVSKPRYGKFDEMAIADELNSRGLDPICGVMVIELATGAIVEWLRLDGDVQELFAVEAMPGVKCPMSVGPVTEEFPDTITFDSEVRTLED